MYIYTCIYVCLFIYFTVVFDKVCLCWNYTKYSHRRIYYMGVIININSDQISDCFYFDVYTVRTVYML